MQVSSCQDYDCVSLSFFFLYLVSFEIVLIFFLFSGKSLSNLCSVSLKSTKGDLVKLIKSRPSGEFKEENIFVKKKPTKQKKNRNSSFFFPRFELHHLSNVVSSLGSTNIILLLQWGFLKMSVQKEEISLFLC